MTSGVRVVGGANAAGDRDHTAETADGPAGTEQGPGTGADPGATIEAHGAKEAGPPGATAHWGAPPAAVPARPTGERTGKRRLGVAALAVVAVLGVAGTIGFGIAWEGLHSTQSGEAQARATARSFLVDLTNFNAKTVDADFSAVSSMATGAFHTQAQRFFNSTIRQELQKALASSRGQIRALYVQSYGSGSATVYAVVDQLYVNSKLTSPQTDVLRIVVDLSQVDGRWKVADVTVLQGPQLGSGTSNGAGASPGSSTSSGSTPSSGTSGTSGSTTSGG